MPEPQKYKLTARQKRMMSDYQQPQHASVQTVEPSVSAIDSIESIYKALSGRDEIKAKALLMLMLRNWLTEVSNFDPVSGHALHTGIIDFLDAVAKSVQDKSPEGEIKDRIYRIVSHSKEAVLAIMEHTRDKILREHAMLPIHAAREVDSNCVQWLSRQPGRTIREKLSGKPYMKAVRRRSSVDTAENRLLRAFLFRLEQILIERQNVLLAAAEETCGELLVSIQRWLRTEDAAEIGAWGNLPPNNTLLQDKRYRKVWDGWLWLQAIDEQITGDGKRVHRDILSVIYWNTLSLLNHSGRFRTIQQPVGLDYDNFSIAPELHVRGYLFPESPSTKLSGSIDKLVSDKGFGFVGGYFFHASDLMKALRYDELKIGDRLLFDVEETPKGKCAKRLERAVCVHPKLFMFELLDEQIDICVDEKIISIIIDSYQIIVTQKNKGTKKKLKIEPATLNDIPKTILSLVTNVPFEYSVPTNNQSGPIRMDSSVVDLCSVRPTFMNNTGFQTHLPFRLIQQNWTLKDRTCHVVDCGNTKAINLHPDIESVSMRSLFLHNSTLPDATKSSTAMFFTKKLSDYIKAEKLTYLVPDWGNDFDLEGIRKSVNFYYDDSSPLPKSIAAIFAWQSSQDFLRREISNNTEILVIDSYYGGFSVTPITAKSIKELKNIIPQSKGITWERHPTFIIENQAILNQIINNLKQTDCPYPEEIIQLFGLDGLAHEAGRMTIEKDSKPFHVPDDILSRCTSKIKKPSSNSDELEKYLKSIKKKNILLLPLSKTVEIDPLLCKFENLTNKRIFNLSQGGVTLNIWQEKVEDYNIALWRDHLPELSIRIVRDGHFENFYLVKDATVTPQRSRTVNIPVEESFTLPAGKTHYSFPLQQGEGNKELQFVAYLKSPAFPLKKATACKLKMTYTYGADDPYELKFIPLDTAEAGFKSIRVEWRSASEGEVADLDNLPVPDFPSPLDWSSFYNFKSNQGNSVDIYGELNSFSSYVADIASYVAFAEGCTELNQSSRHIGSVQSIEEREIDGKTSVCGRILYSNGSVQFRWGPKNIKEGDEVSFEIKKKGRFINANKISKGRGLPRTYSNRLKNELSLHLKRIMVGHSLVDPLCPPELQNSIQSISSSLSTVLSYAKDKSLKESVYLVYACLNNFCPADVGQNIGSLVDRDIKTYWEHAAYCIGNSLSNWQKDVLKSVISIAMSKKFCSLELVILSIALWRSKELINKLSEDELRALSQNLYTCLDYDSKMLMNDPKGFQMASLCKHLELLLALLRSRGIEGEEFKMIFAPDNDLTKQYVTLVDDISKLVIEKDIKLKSRISLHIEKPEMFRNTPDLLYALRMYLTGDSGANTIVITGVSDED